jgi:AAA domain, putative AbiEii toxin, Type IV TA system
MLLRVKNLGPVRAAELDLSKPLIVLTGPNNSGKTYLAWVAYSLSRLDASAVEPPASLMALVERLKQSEQKKLAYDALLAVREDVLGATARAVHDQLPEDFAAPRHRFQATRLELCPTAADDRTFPARKGSLVMRLSDGPKVAVHSALFTEDDDAISFGDLGESDHDLAILIIHLFLLEFAPLCVAFPVERLAINLFARELAAKRTELVDDLLNETSESSLRDKLQQRAGRYPRVIRDALQRAIQPPRTNNRGPFADLADELETGVLGGSIKSTDHDELEFIPHQGANRAPLGLHESASVVKSLVSLVLYLRHDAKPQQRLVIDEPELNLHPDNQRRVTRILAKAVNRGLKIMMSTHSDYVVRELNNLVMLHQDSDPARALIQELGYHADETLRGEQIGAYLVNDGECTPLPVTETGFAVATIEAEIHKLNHDAQTIYLRLFCE